MVSWPMPKRIPKPLVASPRALLSELAGVGRGLAGMPALALDWRTLPRGDGATVMTLPGFMAADRSTAVLRQALTRLGYRAHGWALGRNHGNASRLLPRVVERLEQLVERDGQPAVLIGWSLGGMFAREACRAAPSCVSQIVTLGTPVVTGPAVAHRLPVPITAIYSKRDGVVPWQACIDPNQDNEIEYVEVDVTHLEFGCSPTVVRIIAEVLARRPTERQP